MTDTVPSVHVLAENHGEGFSNTADVTPSFLQQAGRISTMDPLLGSRDDDVARFFLQDTKLRLGRISELAIAYFLFLLLLYCRLLCPGNPVFWGWIEHAGLWILIFAPLFVMDWRNFSHVRYLRRNGQRFPMHESMRYAVISGSECIYKVLLCAYLVFREIGGHLGSLLSPKIIMMPYAVGYAFHFILGHFVPFDEEDRPEGCNVIATLISELGRFLLFVLVVSLSLKVDKVPTVDYDWQAAFWPCWGLEGLVVLIVVLVIPVCMISLVTDRSKTLMLTWVLLSAVGLGTATFCAMYNIGLILDESLCPDPPGSASTSADARKSHESCRDKLRLAMWPWLVFLPAIALITEFTKRHLAISFHEAWYQATRDGSLLQQRNGANTAAGPEQDLPPPVLMFRVTGTYYSRSCEAAMESPNNSIIGGAYVPAAALANISSSAVSNPFGSVSRLSVAAVDPSTSILSARGTFFTEVVESDQLCYICYDEAPNSVLLECGHAGLCLGCATGLMQRRPGSGQAVCPICRTAIVSVLRLRPDLSVPTAFFSRTSGVPARQQPLSLPESDDPECGVARNFAGVGLSGLHSPSSSQLAAAPAAGSALAGSLNLMASAGDATTSSSLGPRLEEVQAAGLGLSPVWNPWPVAARRYAVMVEVVVDSRQPRNPPLAPLLQFLR
eukprot:TRINITY_DN83816_c0_g1_i1.p1 TRINITY_DN83816_c0_g1~~TRINITY_DN83816_c0_g1_i1.p1  ORF type:complete len:680 (-),score=87.21 TRINITY_DN83816_c0_g1_i1:76-2085(-)